MLTFLLSLEIEEEGKNPDNAWLAPRARNEIKVLFEHSRFNVRMKRKTELTRAAPRNINLLRLPHLSTALITFAHFPSLTRSEKLNLLRASCFAFGQQTPMEWGYNMELLMVIIKLVSRNDYLSKLWPKKAAGIFSSSARQRLRLTFFHRANWAFYFGYEG